MNAKSRGALLLIGILMVVMGLAGTRNPYHGMTAILILFIGVLTVLFSLGGKLPGTP